MSVAALWAWLLANEAAVATLLLVISELLGSIPSFKSNGVVSFVLIQIQKFAKKKGGEDPTP
jgi:hypothetical protein